MPENVYRPISEIEYGPMPAVECRTMPDVECRTIPDIEYRAMTEEDTKQVAALEKAVFSSPWSREALLQELDGTRGAHYIVAARGGEVIGCAGFRKVLDEAYITNVAVKEGERRKGVGAELLRRMDLLCARLGILRQTLEVRVSNRAARNLYEKLGFVSAGIRPGFYEKPREDAEIMWKQTGGQENALS